MAVEATANLVQMSAQYEQSRPVSSRRSEMELRLQLSMAIIRMVNGLLDPQQTRVYATAISSLAARIDLPRALVDIRHDATHNSLSSLDTLNIAARQGLAWLQTHYWQAQQEQIVAVRRGVEDGVSLYKKLVSKARKAEGETSMHGREEDVGDSRGQQQLQQKKKRAEEGLVVSAQRGLRLLCSTTPQWAVSDILIDYLLDHRELLLKFPKWEGGIGRDASSDKIRQLVFAKSKRVWGPAVMEFRLRWGAVFDVNFISACITRLCQINPECPRVDMLQSKKESVGAEQFKQRWRCHVCLFICLLPLFNVFAVFACYQRAVAVRMC